VIDHIRLWAVPDPNVTSPSSPAAGDLFKKITLYGGIAPEAPPPDQPASVECDCHNIPVLKTAGFQPGSNSTDNHDVTVSSHKQDDGTELWQIDFENLKWSVPGAKSIQFGVLAEGLNSTWYDLAYPAADGQHLRLFSSAGKLQGPFDAQGPARMNIQVWGHLLARVSIRSASGKLQVILWDGPFLKTGQVDMSSLRFGPRGASSQDVHVEDVRHTGKQNLVMVFDTSASGVLPKSINACLTGRRLDGAPFEGCDLLPH